MSALEWALELARAGFRVFPLYGVIDVDGRWIDERTGSPATHADGSGKRPRLGTDWRQDATTDVYQIGRWWDAYPHSNVGVVMGEGCFVVDCDSTDAIDRFEGFWAEFEGEPLDTFHVRTAQGVHLYFAGESRTFKPADDIDVKGTGGYVVGPGSRSWDGSLYEGVGLLDSIIEAPDWVGQRTRERDDTPRDEWDYLWISGTGDRNVRLSRVVGRLIRLGLPPEVVREALQAINRTCLEHPLPEDEVASTLERMADRYPPGTELQDMLTADELFTNVDGKFFLRALDRRLKKPPVWRYEGLLPEYGVCQMHGASYSGKTFAAIDLALSLCNGMDWMGFQLNGGPRNVLYVMAEGAWDFQRRIDAWTIARPGTSDDRLITVEEQILDLTTQNGWAVLWHQAQEDPDMMSFYDELGLIVVDTQSLLWSAAEENSNTEMNRALLATKLAAKLFKCPVLLVHHSAANEGEPRGRGARSVQAGCDLVMSITAQEGGFRELSVTKVKAGPLPGTTIRFDVVESGESAHVVVDQVVERINHRSLLDETAELIDAEGPQQLTDLGERFSMTAEQRRRFKDSLSADPRFYVERRVGLSYLIHRSGT